MLSHQLKRFIFVVLACVNKNITENKNETPMQRIQITFFTGQLVIASWWLVAGHFICGIFYMLFSPQSGYGAREDGECVHYIDKLPMKTDSALLWLFSLYIRMVYGLSAPSNSRDGGTTDLLWYTNLCLHEYDSPSKRIYSSNDLSVC